MIDQELLKILVCPENKTELRLADAELINSLNQKIENGELKNRSGKVVAEKFDGGLLRADGKILYPIIEQIPVMLIEEGISLS